MSTFTLELLRTGQRAFRTEVFEAQAEVDLWPQIASYARGLHQRDGTMIRVRDESGGIVVLMCAAFATGEIERPAA